ncbi:MAG: AmmeMemoRadiSam system radical SAM enzyme [Treponema sp.]|jgi:pyruvate formate lyase activating enzyme|nr:AmmeMemoRadiSam system radical SAM enzyme [Treponema sp.]
MLPQKAVSETKFFCTLEEDENALKCGLCPHSCALPAGGSGICRVRFNHNGCGELPFYGFVTALAEDPIEKKPLYHFRPGSTILSAGFAGCNLRCPFCQNWHISQNTDTNGRYMNPVELVTTTAIKRCGQIAYTYSEPLVHIEFLLDCMKEAHRQKIANVLVSNGCINAVPAAEVLALTDAANIDLKCFSENTYSKVLGGDLKTVLNFIRTACEKNVHVELTTLIVPGLNDSKEELDKALDFIAGLESSGFTVPWHLSAYHPDWKWEAEATPPELLLKIAHRARERLAYVYTGNITGEKNDTYCRHCGKLLVGRLGRLISTNGLSLKETETGKQYFCAFCKKKAPILW